MRARHTARAFPTRIRTGRFLPSPSRSTFHVLNAFATLQVRSISFLTLLIGFFPAFCFGLKTLPGPQLPFPSRCKHLIVRTGATTGTSRRVASPGFPALVTGVRCDCYAISVVISSMDWILRPNLHPLKSWTADPYPMDLTVGQIHYRWIHRWIIQRWSNLKL